MLVAGATGLIGEALVARLERDGHEVILGVRDTEAAALHWPGRRCLRLDYIDIGDITRELAGIDVVVNAVGIFAAHGAASFDALHVKGPCSLFEQAARAGVARIVQISALGASSDAVTRYLRSKAQGDACAARFPRSAVIVRPSLVFAPSGSSSALFLRLAALPWLPLPGAGRQLVQPIHLDDLVDGLAALIVHPAPPGVVDAVGPQPLPFADYLRTLAAPLQLRPRILPVPMAWALAAARFMQHVPGSLVTPDALAMLAQGSHADPAPWQSLLDHPARAPSAFIADGQMPALRERSVFAALLPLLRASVSLTWLVTAWVSAFVYPRAESLALLSRAQVPDVLAPWALYGAAALDAFLGLLMWLPRWRRLTYHAQFALILFYTLVISLWLPEFWAHPYGPVLKNLPMLALIYLLLKLDTPLLERKDGPGRR